MRLESAEESKVIVTVKRAGRDNREFIEKDGKKIKNKMFEKIVYTTVKSVDVYEAKPEEVVAAVVTGLRAAATKK